MLQALGISNSGGAYHLALTIAAVGKKQAPTNLRGRVTLPYDHRKSAEVILVFAEKNSLSAQLAREAGVHYVGAQELIEPLLEGEINPTKVLSTPGMLPMVTARLARFLGQKGMMPTTRRGGVGEDEELVQRIAEAKGALDWLSSSEGVINASESMEDTPREAALDADNQPSVG
jgi:large subunit ribosomal protein L1